MSTLDLSLVERWQSRRDAEAFDEIVSRYAGLVFGAARRILHNNADAEGVAQAPPPAKPIPVETTAEAIASVTRPYLPVAATADAQGISHLYTSPSTEACVTVAAVDYATEVLYVGLAAATENRLDVRLETGGTLDVRVVDASSRPVEGAEVQCPSGHPPGLTDAQGRVHLDHLSTRTDCQLYATKGGYYMSTKVSLVDALAQPTHEVTLVMRPWQGEWFTERVVDSDTAPIEGAAARWLAGGRGSADAETRTGPDGRYRLHVDRFYDDDLLYARTASSAPAWKYNAKPGPEESPSRVDFVLRPSHLLSGIAVDAASQPIADVRISVAIPNDSSKPVPGTEWVRTGADGHFRIGGLPDSELALWASLDGWVDQEKTVHVDHDVRLVMQRSGVIAGQVLDEETGEPISGFQVHALHNRSGYAYPRQTITDPEGRFVLRGLTLDAEWQAVVDAEGYGEAAGPLMHAALQGAAQPITIKLKREQPLVVRFVTADRSAAPVAGVPVVYGRLSDRRVASQYYVYWNRLMRLDSTYIMPVVEPVKRTSGPDGMVSLPETQPPGVLFICASGYVPIILPPKVRGRYAKGEKGELIVPLAPSGTLQGTVFEGGAPQPGRRLEVGCNQDRFHEEFSEITTDANGHYEVRGLPATTIFLSVLPSGSLPGFSRTIKLAAGEAKTLDLGHNSGPCTLSGQVRGKNGTPLSNVDFRLWSRGSSNHTQYWGSTDAGGKYAFPGLHEGEYVINLAYRRRNGRTITVEFPVDLRKSLHRDFTLEEAE